MNKSNPVESAPLWAWRQEGISSTEKLVLLALASFQITIDGYASASKAQLARRCNISKRTVDVAIESLVRAGLIETILQPARNVSASPSTMYRLMIGTRA